MTTTNETKLPRNPIFCAIDTPDLAHALALGQAIAPHIGGLKIGLEFFNHQGPDGLRKVIDIGAPVFADLKFHDIPNTVAGAVRAIAPLGIRMFNVHASGGLEMMRAALAAAEDSAGETPLVLGVTLLTSLNQDDLQRQGVSRSPSDQVRRLAELTQKAGLDGVVCSAHEIDVLRADRGPDFKLIVPGIRPEGSSVDDQKRIMTPSEAVTAGADVIVIGRPITKADNPAQAAQAISETIGF